MQPLATQTLWSGLTARDKNRGQIDEKNRIQSNTRTSYPKLLKQHVDYTAQHSYQIENIPGVFEKILETQ